MSALLDSATVGLGALLAFGIAGWIVSLFRRDVSIVDGMWPLMFLIAAVCYAANVEAMSDRGWLVLVLVSVLIIRSSLFWSLIRKDSILESKV